MTVESSTLADVDLYVRAVTRPGFNLYSTLRGLRDRDPGSFERLHSVHVVSGDGNRSFAAASATQYGAKVHYGVPETYAKIKKWRPKRRGAWSYLYFLQLAASSGKPAVVMEDDVEVSFGWGRVLEQAIVEANTKFGSRFVLSGYYGYPKCPFANQPELVQPAPSKLPFWGNLLTYWPSHLLEEAHTSFRWTVLNCVDMSTDLTVQHFVEGHGGRLLYVHPGIAQHRGDVTTLRPDGIRRSPTYDSRKPA